MDPNDQIQDQPAAMAHPMAEMMPIEVLKGFRHKDVHDPESTTYYENTDSVLDELGKHIRGGNLSNPLILDYDHDNKWGMLSEGHHRLAAAERAGVTHLPVRVNRTYKGGLVYNKQRGEGASMTIKPESMIGLWKEHVPAEARPSSFIDLPSVVRDN
jgi:hypothetical protein